jgi:hypothetical protein
LTTVWPWAGQVGHDDPPELPGATGHGDVHDPTLPAGRADRPISRAGRLLDAGPRGLLSWSTSPARFGSDAPRRAMWQVDVAVDAADDGA